MTFPSQCYTGVSVSALTGTGGTMLAMSTKSSPASSSPPARRRRRTAPRRPGHQETAAPDSAEPETWPQLLRRYLPFAAAPSLVVALAVVVVCLAGVLLTASPLSYLPAAIGETWLAIHGVPVAVGGVTLGLTPLLTAAGVAAIVAQRVRVATARGGSLIDLGAIAALAVGIPLTLTLVALFMVADASAVYPVALPSPLSTLLPLLVHGAGILIGIAPTVPGLGAAARLVPRLVAAGGAVYLVLLLAGWGRVGQLADAYPTLPATGVAGLTLLTLLYLPNAAVATLGALVGGSVEYAGASASLFSVDPVPLPPVPLFAAIPGGAAPWAPALMLIPVAVLVHFFATRNDGVVEVLATAAWSGAFILLLIPFTGGSAGAYGYVGPHPVAVPALMVLLVAVVGGARWLVATWRKG